jgi:N utilization substance protein B
LDHEMGARRRARELALKALYRADLTGEDMVRSLDSVMELLTKGDPGEDLPPRGAQEPVPREVWEFARRLVCGVKEKLPLLDEVIDESAEHWKLERMTIVDRNILRLGAYELLFCPDIPERVSLNEAVELGKKFGTEDSPSFVNGILDHIVKVGKLEHSKEMPGSEGVAGTRS